MERSKNRYVRASDDTLAVEKLSDGSIAIFDQRSKSVHSLNVSAAIAWEACATGATLQDIAAALGSEDLARTAIEQLHRADLIASDSPVTQPVAGVDRRSIFKTIGTVAAAAAPVVLTLTASEQRAYALISVSVTPTTTRGLT
jgi:hypothetical protein